MCEFHKCVKLRKHTNMLKFNTVLNGHNILLTVHHNISVQQDQQDALFAFSSLL
jgi:hypothetical protein